MSASCCEKPYPSYANRLVCRNCSKPFRLDTSTGQAIRAILDMAFDSNFQKRIAELTPPPPPPEWRRWTLAARNEGTGAPWYVVGRDDHDTFRTEIGLVDVVETTAYETQAAEIARLRRALTQIIEVDHTYCNDTEEPGDCEGSSEKDIAREALSVDPLHEATMIGNVVQAAKLLRKAKTVHPGCEYCDGAFGDHRTGLEGGPCPMKFLDDALARLG